MAEVELLARKQLALGRMLELTDLMLGGAKEQRWESISELQNLRDRLIHDFFAEETVVDEVRIAESIEYIIESDKQLATLVREERNLLQQQIQKMNKGKSAVKAYATE
ncbi:flagellar protein FliT [Methylomarinum sp. Ch1-1]|uniref:Flagellar protein FliT n=1 Tax=Methylomarinum roseum TaxID=3067653 RepID=A0AAU7NUM7_9GAMM|nr:flagellar protein FliT [Methylomarinum sp. Ch1-1]MDP4519246.1 flagellar protein FliT [Methylomarinum sp. Ch1-1]